MKASQIAGAITERFPAATGPGSDDICYASTNRQQAVQAVARESDLVLVAGSANSSNSRRLVEMAERAGTTAYLVDSAEIELGWLAGASTIETYRRGVGTSAIVDQILAALSGLGTVKTKDVVVATETVQFGLPKELRRSQACRCARACGSGSYLMGQKIAPQGKVSAARRAGAAVCLQSEVRGLRQDPAASQPAFKQRMPVEQAIAAIEECGAPMVSIAGGEPLMHPQIDVIVEELIKRKKFVFLCTNALLIPKKLDKFKPSPFFAWVVHIDGLKERHDESVCKEGVFDEAVAAIKEIQRRGFRVNTNTTFFNTDTPQTVIDVLNFLNDDLKIDDMQISPAYAYEKAPDQEHFLGVTETSSGAVPKGIRGGEPEAVAATTSHAAVPGLSRG